MEPGWNRVHPFAQGGEGRLSELSRRATCMLLFTRNGRPGPWLVAVALAWAVVSATALGTPG